MGTSWGHHSFWVPQSLKTHGNPNDFSRFLWTLWGYSQILLGIHLQEDWNTRSWSWPRPPIWRWTSMSQVPNKQNKSADFRMAGVKRALRDRTFPHHKILTCWPHTTRDNDVHNTSERDTVVFWCLLFVDRCQNTLFPKDIVYLQSLITHSLNIGCPSWSPNDLK